MNSTRSKLAICARGSGTTQQIDGLPVAEPTGHSADYSRHDGGIESVAVECDQKLGSRFDQTQHRLEPLPMHLMGADEVDTCRLGVRHVRWAG